jgi:hypothetical protein
LAALSSFKDLELDLISQLFNSKPFIMKTLKQYIIRNSVLTFLLIFISVNSIKGQCGGISNNYGCQITVNIELRDGSPCTNTCTVFNGVVINSSGFYTITCGTCINGTCYVRVTIIDIGGSSVGPFISDYSSGTTTISGPGACSTGTIYYDSNSDTFKVQ